MTQDAWPSREHEVMVLPDAVPSRALSVHLDSEQSTALLFGEPTVADDASTQSVPARLTSAARTLLGRDDGIVTEPRVRAGRGPLTVVMITLGVILGVLALIDAMGGDTNDMALGTFAVAVCFIVAVLAEAMLDAPRRSEHSRAGRNRPFRP